MGDMEAFKIGGLRRHEDGSMTVYVGTTEYEAVGRVRFDPNQFRAFYLPDTANAEDLGLFPSEYDAVDAIFARFQQHPH